MGLPLITPEQAVNLVLVMEKRMRRPDFRHNPGFAFHTSWDRATGRPRARSTKADCINAVVGALMGKSTCPSQPQAQWLDRMIPGWREEISMDAPAGSRDPGKNKGEASDNGQGQ